MVRQKKKTKPIINFLDFLSGSISNNVKDAGNKRTLIRNLQAELADVSFSLDSKEFGENFEILPLGIGKNAYQMSEDVLFCTDRNSADATFHELVVMSPFLSESVIADFNIAERGLSDSKRTSGGGSVQERALMYAILKRIPEFSRHKISLEKFMIMDAVKAWDWTKLSFENRVFECEKESAGKYPANVIQKILDYPEYPAIRDMLLNHLHERRYGKQLTYSNYYVMNKLRVMFARISVSMLEPDLVIMDEFQRFKFLLSSDDSELGILAHSFLGGHDTRVLLLSATPYKLYSTLEEIDENQLDEHYAEFYQVMDFLFDDADKNIRFKEIWKNYSIALSELKSGDGAILNIKKQAENAMYQGVSRTERISVMDSGDYTDDSSVKNHLQVDANDINSYIQMSKLLSATDSRYSLPVDYVKSCPYLMSFLKKYKIKEQIEKYYTKHPEKFGNEKQQNLLWLNRSKINKYDELPKTNARLEALKEKAFINGAEKYMWVPPSKEKDGDGSLYCSGIRFGTGKGFAG